MELPSSDTFYWMKLRELKRQVNIRILTHYSQKRIRLKLDYQYKIIVELKRRLSKAHGHVIPINTEGVAVFWYFLLNEAKGGEETSKIYSSKLS